MNCRSIVGGEARVAELADAPDLGSGVERRAGSSPVSRTTPQNTAPKRTGTNKTPSPLSTLLHLNGATVGHGRPPAATAQCNRKCNSPQAPAATVGQGLPLAPPPQRRHHRRRVVGIVRLQHVRVLRVAEDV